MFKLRAELVCLLEVFAASSSFSLPLTRVADVQSAIDAGTPDTAFDISATVALSTRAADTIYAIDESGGGRFSCTSNLSDMVFLAGDRIRARGKTIRTFENRARAVCDSIDVLSHCAAPPISDVSAKDLWKEDFLLRPVRIKGRVMHAFRDEIAPDWIYLILDCQGETAYVALRATGNDAIRPFDLIETHVCVEGICDTLKYSNRRQVVRLVYAASPSSVKVVAPRPKDPFNVPSLSEIAQRRPEEVQKLGRHGCTGRVLSVWGKSDMLLKTHDSEIIRVDLLQPGFPKPGVVVDVVGIPNVSGMRVSLSKAIWRPSSSPLPAGKPPVAISLGDLLTDAQGRSCINVNYYGEPVIVRGHVRSLLTGESERCFLLESQDFTIEVDAGVGNTLPKDLCYGCDVSVRGTFVVETDTWKSNHLLPQIKRAKIVMRDSSDLEIESFPPWWTTKKLTTAIAILGVFLFAILAWNVSLRRVSELRGRELASESLARAEADIKVLERKRLAFELHDAVAQSLTAIGMELETASRYQQGSSPELLQHLFTAETTLKSCRDELRNCLWDLRNQALEEPTMEQAIRKTLLPHTKGIWLAVRFSFPRENLTDNTAHIILRIIRELVINAIRHGHADYITVAGSSEADVLLFSVHDNGSGFDPKDCPGVLQGHFGLQGIKEQIRPFCGTLNIESTKKHGTKATITFPLPHTNLT